MSKVTVIVPVYRVSDFLPACIESVLRQTMPDFELILVDDGSPDTCPAICDRYGAQDSRIRVIHKENGGLSSARNAALPLIHSEFTFFLDGDDWLDDSALETLTNLSGSADVVIGNYRYSYDTHETIADQALGDCTLSGYEALKQLVSGTLQNFAWGKLIRTSLAQAHPFPEGKLFEDHYWAHWILAEARTVAITAAPLVHYRQRASSISYSFTLRRMDAVDGWRARAEYLQQHFPELLPLFLKTVSDNYIGIAWLVCTRMKQQRQDAVKILRDFSRDYALSECSSGTTKQQIQQFQRSVPLFLLTTFLRKCLRKIGL